MNLTAPTRRSAPWGDDSYRRVVARGRRGAPHTWYANLAVDTGGLMQGAASSQRTISRADRGRKSNSAAGTECRAGNARRSENASAIIAVSHGMRADVPDCYPNVDPAKVHVVHNGIDTEQHRPQTSTRPLERLGAGRRSFTSSVGRITARRASTTCCGQRATSTPGILLVLAAAAPDTPEMARGRRRRRRAQRLPRWASTG